MAALFDDMNNTSYSKMATILVFFCLIASSRLNNFLNFTFESEAKRANLQLGKQNNTKMAAIWNKVLLSLISFFCWSSSICTSAFLETSLLIQ